MAESFDREFVTSVIEHMNLDHADAVVNYAQAFGQLPDAVDLERMQQVLLTDVTSTGVELGLVDVSGQSITLDIAYNETGLPERLESEEQVRSALVFMAKAARKIIAG